MARKKVKKIKVKVVRPVVYKNKFYKIDEELEISEKDFNERIFKKI